MAVLAAFPARSRFRGDGSRDASVEVYSDREMRIDGVELLERFQEKGRDVWHYVTRGPAQDVRSLLIELSQYGEATRAVVDRMLKDLSKPLEVPMVMGIINATPDSFYEGSRVGSEPVKKIEEMLDQKPDIIDVGGESTRPGSDPVPPKEEIKRLRPVVEYLTEVSDIPVSIDTRNPETLEDMLRYDIDYVNDITGFTNEAMLSLTTSADLKCIVMHMRGDPKTMQSMTDYRDVVYEVASFLQAQARKIIEVGAEPESIVVDPGLGFAKDSVQNMVLISNMECFRFGFPLLVGASRKTFIGRITGRDVNDRLPGTIASSIFLMEKGVDILRVHDVRENRDALRMYLAMKHFREEAS